MEDQCRGRRGGGCELAAPAEPTVETSDGDTAIMNAAAGSSAPSVSLEIDDIQSGALHHRPAPYEGRFVFLRVDDRHAGRALLRRLLPAVDAGLPTADPHQDA